MEKFIIKASLVLLVLVLILAILGCDQFRPPEPVTIQFAYPNFFYQHFEDYAAEFEEQHPYITIELEPLFPSELSDLQPEDADAFLLAQADLGTYIEQDTILNFDAFISFDENFEPEDYLPGTLDLLSFQGETWGIPMGADLMVLYYNKDLFDEFGLPYPHNGWTWDDLIATATLMTDADRVPTPIYGYSTFEGYLDSLIFIGAHGGSIFDDIQNPTTVTFTDPRTIAGLEFFADFFHEFQIAPTSASAQENYTSPIPLYEGIRRGRVGMWISWSSDQGGRGSQNWIFNWGMVPLPRGEFPATPFLAPTVYTISAATAHPKECWQWISFLSHRIPRSTFPARKSLIGSPAFANYAGAEIAEVVRNSLPYAAPISIHNWVAMEDTFMIFSQAVATIIEGEATPQEAMEHAQQQALDSLP